MKFHRQCLIFLISIILTGAAQMLWAGTLEGVISDPSGAPVPNAQVSLLQALQVVAERQTDARGAYRFEELQGGSYQIVANAHGLSGPAMDVALTQSESKQQDIQLKISAMTSQVVVSASLGGALLPQIGSSVNVLNRQQIEDLGVQNIADALRGTPGTEITQTGRRGGMASVSIRGGESNFNAILVDGIPMNQFGGEFYLASLPADGIERVEVIRGSESAVYGSNAMTGVINLISRKGEGRPQFTASAGKDAR